jgi:hypothetical protein
MVTGSRETKVGQLPFRGSQGSVHIFARLTEEEDTREGDRGAERGEEHDEGEDCAEKQEFRCQCRFRSTQAQANKAESLLNHPKRKNATPLANMPSTSYELAMSDHGETMKAVMRTRPVRFR